MNRKLILILSCWIPTLYMAACITSSPRQGSKVNFIKNRKVGLEDEIETMKERIQLLQKENDNTTIKLDEIGNSFLMMETKTEEHSDRLKELEKRYNINKSNETSKDISKVPVSSSAFSQNSFKKENAVSKEKKVSLDDSGNLFNESTEIEPDKQLYDSALNHIRLGQYGQAIIELEEYISLFPESNLTDNALYWIGECYYKKNNYQRAVEEFKKVIESFPDGNKVPPAMLKLAYSLDALGEYQQAIQQLNSLIQKYPLADVIPQAKERLKVIKNKI
ncbi:MAG: tol-pal system protein YbgF [bacterium]